jgi:fatty-acyl-CoA synthase
MSALKMWVRALEGVKNSAHLTLPGLIDELAVIHGDRIALTDGTDVLTYDLLALRVNRYARWGIKRQMAGKTVALLMPNRADYVAIWLGLTRVGCTVALLNTNLSHKALTHCLCISGAQFLVTSDFVALVNDAGGLALNDWPLSEMASIDGSALTEPFPSPHDVALFIYTSGTTGLPKAAKVTHRRVTEWSFWFAGMTNAAPHDSLYNCLPMYHSIGGIVAVGSMLVAGGSVVIRDRFSASRFWDDVVKSQCTICQYIGELCRYLTVAPVNPVERRHRLRLAVGNGLQVNVWRNFQDRFAIPQILEYYAATEGVLSLYNCEGKPGSIGRIPPILEPYFATKLIRVDQETGEPVRDAAGFCVVADRDEPGEAITRIWEDRTFDGYDDVEASLRKMLRSVFVDGDRWYRTGDLMRKDAAGFYYFVDRLGDTFRWKGENVSTTEVTNVVRACPGVIDAVVYGVKVSQNEGRAGMAAITTRGDFSLENLASHLQRHLPAYAKPLFVRMCQSLDTTATFKLAKARFVAEGYTNVDDPIFAWQANGLVPFVQEDGC